MSAFYPLLDIGRLFFYLKIMETTLEYELGRASILLSDSMKAKTTSHKKGDWITMNGTHVQVGSAQYNKIAGGSLTSPESDGIPIVKKAVASSGKGEKIEGASKPPTKTKLHDYAIVDTPDNGKSYGTLTRGAKSGLEHIRNEGKASIWDVELQKAGLMTKDKDGKLAMTTAGERHLQKLVSENTSTAQPYTNVTKKPTLAGEEQSDVLLGGKKAFNLNHGHVISIGEPPSKATQHNTAQLHDVPLSHPLFNETGATEITPKSEVHTGSKMKDVIFNDGTVVNKSYLAHFTSNFPDAQFKRTSQGHVLVKSKGSVVGMIAPKSGAGSTSSPKNRKSYYADESGELLEEIKSIDFDDEQAGDIMDINDTLISYGGAIKTLGETDDTVKIGGYLVEFGSADNHDSSALRDYFDKDTDFRIAADGAKSAVYYHHGLNPTLKTRQLATADIGIDDSGVWFEAELSKRDKYEAKIAEMARMGKLGLSSGTASHLVRRTAVKNAQGVKANHIDLWPLGLDASLTPTPAQPSLTVMALKSVELDGDDFELGESTFDDEFKGWDESAHNRDGDGKFGSGSSGSGGGENGSATKPDGDLQKSTKDLLGKAAQSLNKHLSKVRDILDDSEVDGKGDDRIKAEHQKIKDLSEKFKAIASRVNSASEDELRSDPSLISIGGKIGDIGKKAKLYADRAASYTSSKSFDQDEQFETKHYFDLENNLQAGLSFEDHSSKVLATVKEIEERVDGLTAIRCIKSERRWSANNYERLNALADGLVESGEAIKAQAEEYKPRDMAAVDAELQRAAMQAVAEFQVIQARMNGVII